MIILAGLLAYGNSFKGAFVFDDYIWIVDNPSVRSLKDSVSGSSRPLVGLTLYVNGLFQSGEAGKPDPAGYHAFNLLVHIGAGLLLFLLLRLTLSWRGGAAGGGDSPPATVLAAAIALIWLVHPLHTESVTYIIQRSESLMGLFYLGTLYCAARGVSSTQARRWEWGAIACCALGMGCKPVMVTAPVMVWLYDRTFQSGGFLRALRERKLMYLGLAATWLILGALLSVANESTTSAGFHAGLPSWSDYLKAQPAVIGHYVKLAFVPYPLCVDYWWPLGGDGSAGGWLQGAAVLVLAACSAVWGFRGHPVGFWGAWFFLILAPSSSVIPVADPAAEHRMYLPLISLVTLAVLGAEKGLRSIPGLSAGRTVRGRVGAGAAIVIAACLMVLTVERNRDYGSEETIWGATVRVAPHNPRAWLGMGTALLRNGRAQEAEGCLTRILAIAPDAARARSGGLSTEYVFACNNLGVIHFQRGDFKKAEGFFRRAAEVEGPGGGAQANLERAIRMQAAPGP